MSMLPLNYLPGVCKVNSAYADTSQGGYANGRLVSGRFTDMDKARFVAGFPEKLGGWVKDIAAAVTGVPRGILPWRDNSQNIRLGIGTNLKLYFETLGALTDITPWRAILTGTLTNALDTTSTSTTVTVHHTAHGLSTGDYIILVAGSAVGGIQPAGVFNPITKVDANTYTITNPTAATGTVTGGGGTITYTYYRVTLSNPFGTTNGSANVIVTHANHGASAGDFVTISNATAVAGLTLNGEFQITSVSTNTYSITAPSNANATTTGGGSPQFQYDISGGPSDTVVGFGYGTGGYGGGGYGTMGSTGITFLARVWSLAHYGQQLLASPTGGTIYVWDPVIGGRAYPLYNAPAQVLAMFITPERFVVALGINGNAMQLAWADQNDYTVWTSTPTNTANTGRTLQSGAFFVGGIAARDGVILILSNTACISMTYTGDNNVYATQTVGDGSELAGPLAIAVIGGIAYWMGLSEFWTWNGSVTPLPSDDIRDYVFQNINLGQSQKFVAGSNRSKKEVFFFYCSASSNEIDRYVIYHIDQGCWSIGSLQRTSWADLGLLANPMATDASGFIYDHETGTDAAGSAMDSYVVLSPQDISKGAQIMEYFALYPDFERVVGDTTFSLLTQTYPMDAESIDGPYTIAPDGSTSRIDLRNSAKLIGFKLESNVVGGDWRLGLPRIEAQPGGARR